MSSYAVPLDVAFADGPAPDFADKLQLFGQFVGSWELEVIYHGPTGGRTLTAEWHFGCPGNVCSPNWSRAGCAVGCR